MPDSNTCSYKLELEKWGIRNDGLDAVNTTTGINNALQWALDNGYTECILPKGQYLIDEKSSINLVSNMTLNLNSSILKENPNGLAGYVIVKFNNVKNSRICNGIIKGDSYEHNYDPKVSATHEFGCGIGFYSGSDYCYAESLEISQCTGDSISVGQYGVGKYETYIPASNIELGDIADNGTNATSTIKVRTLNSIPLTNSDFSNFGYFRLTGHAYWGNGSLTCPYYDIFFYDSTNTLISFSRKVDLYEKKNIPTNAKSVRLAFYQSSQTAFNSDWFIFIKLTMPPTNIYIENNKLFDSRRCGISLYGTSINVVNNEIYNINGTAPKCAMDMEEGWGVNKDLRVINNYIHDVPRGILLSSGTNSIVRDNIIERTDIIGMFVTTTRANIINNRFNKASVGMHSKEVSLFQNNEIIMTELSLNYEGAIIKDCKFYNAYIRDLAQLSRPYEVKGCLFMADSIFDKGFFISIYNGSDSLWHVIDSCTFKGIGSAASQASIDKSKNLGAKLIIDNCLFDNTAEISVQNANIQNCRIIGTNIFINNSNSSSKSLISNINYCKFTIINNQKGYYNPIFISDLSVPNQVVNVINNTFEVRNDMTEDIIRLVNCKEFIFEDNKVFDNYTTSNKIFIRYWNSIIEKSTIKNNFFISLSNAPYAYDTTWSQNLSTTFVNNYLLNFNTKIRPEDKVYSSSGATSARPLGLEVGYQFFDTTLGKPIWVKASGDGYSAASNSSRKTSYKTGQLVFEGTKVYECTTLGMSGITIPTWNTTKGTTTIDGTVIWTCRGNITIWIDSSGNQI